ncbi:MAG: hypothetical protein U5K76_10840 [Woeseiaceae bacterium]|nr:hypothetical protein [Woeseiaceae bacterium]
MKASILAYGGRRYLWLALLVTAGIAGIYLVHDPQEPPNGGTVLGYTLGAVATALVLWLTAFGIRKRRYHSTQGTVQGWLSAHVYLGLALPLIVLLHAGFQLGPNVHTLAFVLLLLVVASGIVGVWFYANYPARMSHNRGGANRTELLDQLDDIDERSRRAANSLGEDFRDAIASGIARTQLGGTAWSRLTGRDESQVVLPANGGSRVAANAGQEALLDWLADRQARSADAHEGAAIGELSALLRNKRRLLKTLAGDMQLEARLAIWLFAHVPLTAALLAALVVHIVTVFLYW